MAEAINNVIDITKIGKKMKVESVSLCVVNRCVVVVRRRLPLRAQGEGINNLLLKYLEKKKRRKKYLIYSLPPCSCSDPNTLIIETLGESARAETTLIFLHL